MFAESSSSRASLIARCGAAIAEAIARIRERHSLRRELAGCATSGMLDGILTDIGISRVEMEQLVASHPRASSLRRSMAERLGIDGHALGYSRFQREIELTCASCPSHRRCREWLRSGARQGYQAFCPNAPLFDSLRSQPGAHRASVI